MFWQGFAGNRWKVDENLFSRGKSELQRATQRVTPFGRKVRNSGTERMSAALILVSGTGEIRGVGGVKTAKLCVKQDQIGKREAV